MGRQANHEGQRHRRIVSVELTDYEIDAIRDIRDYLEKSGKVRKQSTISAALRYAICMVANWVRRRYPREDENE